MKILSGAYTPDAGEIELEGLPYHAARSPPRPAERDRDDLPGAEPRAAPERGGEHPSGRRAVDVWAGSSDAQRQQLARAAMAELRHESIPLDAPVHACSIAEQQVVEIARALVGQPKVIIMDEPTSSLTQVDTENLFAVIRRLRERGVSVVYISHFLEECQRICDRYTVLRDGESVGSGRMASASLNEIIRMMVGREIQDIYPRTPHTPGPPVFELRELAGQSKPRSVSLTLHEGEILGIAGLVGAGRTETLRACFGLDRVRGGAVLVGQQEDTRARPGSRLAQGVGLLSENRKEEGLLLSRSLADNLTITRFAPVSRFGFISRQKQNEATRHWMEQLDVRAASPTQPISELSGGNQQKIAVGRLLHHDARVLLLDEPTRGIDVGSKVQIYQWMGRLAAQGKAIIFVSSYLPELLGVCDSIGVMCRGVLSAIRPASHWTEHSIIATAIGQAENERLN